MRRLMAVMMLALMVTGCGGSVSAGGVGDVAAVETIADVDYYFACGNEVLILDDGRSFHPLPDQGTVDPTRYADVQAAGAGLLQLALLTLAVAPPGLGDDIGSLVIYEDGVARFESQSGIVAWLSEDVVIPTYDC